MITEKDNVFYCDCGFSFERGRSGAHNCETGLRKKIAESEAKLAALAAENGGLKESRKNLTEFINDELNDDYPLNMAIETPATDAFLAEVREQAHKEGAHFVANRMLAAWEAGFIDDTAKNAADIARMILTSTEFMADARRRRFRSLVR